MSTAFNNLGYVIDKDDNGVEYIVHNSGDNPHRSIKKLLKEDLFSLVIFLENTDNSDTLSYYWHEIPRASLCALDYIAQSRALLLAFAYNKHTPESVISDAIGNINPYGDLYLGIEPNITDVFIEHHNCPQEAVKKFNERNERIGKREQEEFDALARDVARANAAYAKDDDLLNRMRSVKEERGLGLQRVMRFNKEDVEALGADYVRRNFVHLFGVEYNEKTGTFTGYID